MGRINDPCAASAILCKIREVRAMEEEQAGRSPSQPADNLGRSKKNSRYAKIDLAIGQIQTETDPNIVVQENSQNEEQVQTSQVLEVPRELGNVNAARGADSKR
jgi:hypothetical protein